MDYSNNYNIYKLPSEKNFGYTFSIVFFILSLYFFFKSEENLVYSSFFISLTILFLVITFFKPNYFKSLNILWFKFGIIISKIINPIILGLLYFIIFTPFAIWFKIIKRDALKINYNSNETYWDDKIYHKTSMKNQF